MRYRAVSTTLFVTLCVFGCAANPSANEPRGSGGSGGSSSPKGGSSGEGGATTSAGGSATGGSAASGGAASEGGTSNAGSTGGSSSSSGGSNAGGASARGGAGGSGNGGSVSTGACTDVAPDSTPCSRWKEWNQCSIPYLTDGHFCEQTCGRCSGSASGGSSGAAGSSSRGGAGGAAGSAGGGASGAAGKGGGSGNIGGSPGPGSTNPPITGSNGYATRYWDCCKPSCSWTTSVQSCQKDGMTRITDRNAKSGCEGGPAYECYDFAPWYDAGTNMSYGFVAHNGVPCGTCYMFQFTGEGQHGPNAGSAAIKGQQMVVQTVNIGGLGGNQFDLLVPGGGVGDFAAGCNSQWGSTGAQTVYGGMLADCKGDCSCMKGKCSSFFGNNPTLKAGCDWFTNWYSCADNPKLIYKQVSCPSQLTSRSGL